MAEHDWNIVVLTWPHCWLGGQTPTQLNKTLPWLPVIYMPLFNEKISYKHWKKILNGHLTCKTYSVLIQVFLAHLSRRLTRWAYRMGLEPASVHLSVRANKLVVRGLGFRFWLCWGLTSQSTIFQSYRDGAIASWVINQYFRGVKCLAQGHNTAAVGLEPRTSRSGVRHSTTEPPRSPRV